MTGNATYPLIGLPALNALLQTDAEIISDPTGLATTTERFRCKYADAVSNANLTIYGGEFNGTVFNRSYRSPHWQFPSLCAFAVKIKRKAGVLNGELSIQYRGLDPSLAYPPPPIYTIETTTGNETLQSHPLWTSDIAGTPTTPLNGSQWVDSAGNYNPPNATTANPGTFDPTTAIFYQWINTSIFVGIEDYLAAGIIFKSTYTTLFSPSDDSAVGSFSPPSGPAPGLPDGYDWFYLGLTTEDNSGIYRNEATWKAVPTGPAAMIIYG